MGPGSSCVLNRGDGLLAALAAIAVVGILALAAPGTGWAQTFSTSSGELDCNGDSPIQQSVRMTMNCTDIRGFSGIDNKNTWDGRFYDNGLHRTRRAGHDVPVEPARLRPQHHLDRDAGARPGGGAHRRQTWVGCGALARADPGAMVLDGDVRPELLSGTRV